MRTRNCYKCLTIAAALVVLFILVGTDVMAQTLTNNSSTVSGGGVIQNYGRIRFKQNNGQFINNRATPISTALISNTSGTFEFAGNVAAPVFAGSGPVGSAATERMTGYTEFTANAGASQITGIASGTPTYYENLSLKNASSKSLADGIFVSNIYLVASSGNRTYAGTFHYDGGAQTIVPEGSTIGSENYYDNLDLTNTVGIGVGPGTDKTVAYIDGIGTTNAVLVNRDISGGAPLKVYDDMIIGRIAGTPNTYTGSIAIGQTGEAGSFEMRTNDLAHSADLTVDNGNYNIAGAGNYTFTGGTMAINANGTMTLSDAGYGMISSTTASNIAGTLTITSTIATADVTFSTAAPATVADAGLISVADGGKGDIIIGALNTLTLANGTTGGLINLGTGGTNLLVHGTLTNSKPERTNMTFADASSVTYDGADGQTIVTTVTGSNHEYYNLIVDGGGTKTPQTSATANDINIRAAGASQGTLALGGTAETMIDMGDFTLPGNRPILIMGTGAATYTTGLSEVRGNLRRLAPTDGGLFTFNNAATTVQFHAGSTPSAYYQIGVLALTPSNQIPVPVPGYYDIQRTFRVASSGTVGTYNGEMESIRVAYRADERPGGMDETILRPLEGYIGNTAREEKITTGVLPTRQAAGASWGYLQINGGNVGTQKWVAMLTNSPADGGDRWEVGQLSDIILTDQRNQLITVVNGRWSADGTWDEGRPPMSNEDAIVRHQVWTGDNVARFGGAAEDRLEQDVPGVLMSGVNPILCNQVIMDPADNNPATPQETNIAIVIANNDITGNTVPDPNLVYIFGQQAGPANGIYNNNNTPGTEWDFAWANFANMQGINVFGTVSGRTSNMRASQLTNYGRITNNGLIEIGD